MGIFDKYVKRRARTLGLGAVQKTAGFMPLETSPYPDGRVEPESKTDFKTFIDAFRSLPWIYAAGMAAAIAASKAPLNIVRYSKAKNGKRKAEFIDGQPLNDLLERPNPDTSWTELLQNTVINLSITGNAFWNLVGTKEGQPISPTNPPVEIWWVKPEAVDIETNTDGTIRKYVYKGPNGTESALDPSEIIHFRMPNPDSYWRGLSMLEPLKNTLIQEYNAVTFNKKFLENDGQPPLILEWPGEPSKDQRSRFWASWDERHKGAGKAGRAGMIWGGMKINPIGTPPKDAQYIEMRKMNREEMLAGMMTPPSIVGLLEYANYSNMDVQHKKFLQDAVLPVLGLIAGKITHRLVPLFEQKAVAEFDTSVYEALKEDEERQARIRTMYIQYGIKSPNMILEEMGMDPYDGGDQRYMPMGLIPVGGYIRDDQGDGDAAKEKAARRAPRARHGLIVPKEGEGAGEGENSSFWRNDEKRRVLWEAFIRRVGARERGMIPAVERYLKRQADDARRAAGKYEDVANVKLASLFDENKETEVYSKDFYTRYMDAFKRAGQAGYEATKGMIYIDPEERNIKAEDGFEPSPEQVAKLKAQIEQAAKYFNASTFETIKADLLKAQAENWTIEQFTQSLWEHIDNLAVSRARLISRTEMSRTENWGGLEGYKDNEYVTMKGWMCSFVEDSRDAHQVADGQEVNIGDDFKVGSEFLGYPGDPRGEAGNVCNCLCSIYPVVGDL